MPTIKSDLSNRTLPGGQFREISVPDAGSSFEGAGPGIDFDQADALMRERGLPPVDRSSLQNQFNARQAAARSAPVFSDQEVLDYERQIKEAKQAKASGKERLSVAAKQRIEMLIGMTRGIREVLIDGKVYLLKTLKGKEQRAAIMAASEFDNTVESVFEIRKQLLARALTEVAGTDLELFLGDGSLETRLFFVEEMDESVLNKLYTEYLTLVNETQQKYFVKNDQEAKEVLSDLKK